MDILLHPKSEEPLYKQIYRQIVGQIASGKAIPGESLPSIRSAARYLGTAVITVKTAYEELEKDGYIVALPAKGCFIADSAPQVAVKNRFFAAGACDAFLDACKNAGMTEEEITDLLDEKMRR